MSKKLYIFDFDETLVTCDSYIYILNDRQERIRKLDAHEYFAYEPIPGEFLDVSEFDLVVNPKIHDSIFDLLLKYKDEAIILTARTKKKPVKDFFLSLNLDLPIYAIGSNRKPKNPKLTNAKRKAKWIHNIATKEEHHYIEFWDDSELNIKHTEKALLNITKTKMVCHLVNHKLK